MSNPKAFNTRAKVLLVVYLLGLGALVLRLGFLQFVHGPALARLALTQWLNMSPLESERGVIYDRNGQELALSIDADAVFAIPARIREPRQSAKALAEALGVDVETVFTALTRPQTRVRVANRLTAAQVASVRALGLPGVHIQPEAARFYPFGQLASHVLGFVGRDLQGLGGVEFARDELLRGERGAVLSADEPQYVPPEAGGSLMLTIDEFMQHVVERELDQAIERHRAQSALAIVMDPKTGEILALANRPSFDPNQFQLYPEELRRNTAVSDSFEPGSTFKIVTAAAALNEDLIAETDRFQCPGYVMVAGRRISCWRAQGHGELDFGQIMDVSCNPGFVSVGQRLGTERLFRYIADFGFGIRTGVDLPGEATGIMFRQVGPVELATTSFGQGPAVTPLQQLAAISAIANGGVRMRPMLVKRTQDSTGQPLASYAPQEVARPISAETAERLTALLESTVARGSGRNAAIAGYRVAGKTGTAQIPQPGGGYFADRYIASFIGFAPADDPQIAILVMVHDPRGQFGFYGSQVAAPAFRAMMADILRYRNIEPSTDVPLELQPIQTLVPDLTGLTATAAVSQLRDLGFNLSFAHAGDIIVSQHPQPNTPLRAGATVVLTLGQPPRVDGMVAVPNVLGLSMREASVRVEGLGLRIIVAGTGLAYAQEHPAGTLLPAGAAIRVRFRHE